MVSYGTQNPGHVRRVMDFDGTLTLNTDVGRDCLARYVGFDHTTFPKEVERIRQDRDYRKGFEDKGTYPHLTGVSEEPGIELALLLCSKKVRDRDVKEDGRSPRELLRPGVKEYIDAVGRVDVLTAAPEDWVKSYIDGNLPGATVDVIGTKLEVDGSGRYISITVPCGRASKVYRIARIHERGTVPIVGGNSSGDDLMMRYAQENDGLAIGFNDDPNSLVADIVLPADASWFEFWALENAFLQSRGYQGTPHPQAAIHDFARVIPKTRTGREVLDYIKSSQKDYGDAR